MTSEASQLSHVPIVPSGAASQDSPRPNTRSESDKDQRSVRKERNLPLRHSIRVPSGGDKCHRDQQNPEKRPPSADHEPQDHAAPDHDGDSKGFSHLPSVAADDGVLERVDGRVRVRVAAPMALSIAEHLAGWGAAVEVLEPDSVKAELARLGAELVQRYAPR